MDDLLQSGTNAFVVLTASGGQIDFPGRAHKKRGAQVVFKYAYLAADRTLSDVQFACCQGKAQVASSGFERHETVQWRQGLQFHQVRSLYYMFYVAFRDCAEGSEQ
ncbi:hypothetical protein D3C75_1008460 [compost metagenome]